MSKNATRLILFYLALVAVFIAAMVTAADAQTYDPTRSTVSNKPYAPATAVPTDARSYYFDPVLLKYRPYQSTAEVLSYLNSTTYRTGNFPIYVSNGVLQSNGTFTGGSIREYWFKDGTGTSNLVRKSVDFNTILGTPTTRTGYGLTDVYTITEANNQFESKVTGTTSADFWDGSKTFRNFNTAARAAFTPSGSLTLNSATGQLNVPSSLPPSGAAAGNLSGTYPNPSVKWADGYTTYDARYEPLGGVTIGAYEPVITGTTSADFWDGSKHFRNFNTAARLAISAAGTVTYNNATGVITGPAALPPNGAAGRHLSGSYPNPSVKWDSGFVTYDARYELKGAGGLGTFEPIITATTSVDFWDGSKHFRNFNTAARAALSGTGSVTYNQATGVINAPTSLPPSGAASGDLAGTYPAPSVAWSHGYTTYDLRYALIGSGGGGGGGATNYVQLTDGATINWTNTTGHAYFTIGGNRTLSIVDADGAEGTILITQDATGGRNLTVGLNDRLAEGINVIGSTNVIDLSDKAGTTDEVSYTKKGTVRWWSFQRYPSP